MADTTFDFGPLLNAGINTALPLIAANQGQSSVNNALGQQTQSAGNASSLLQPYANLGTQAAQKLSAMQQPGFDITTLPGYAAGQGQVEKTVNRGLASRGQYGSGGAVPAIGKAVSDYASNQYGNEFARLSSLLNSGQNAANAQSGIYQNLGNAQGAAGLTNGNYSQNGLLGAGTSLANYLGATPKGSSTSNGSALVGTAANAIGGLWNQYFGGSNGYNSDGSLYGSPYTGSGNTVDSLISNGGWGGSGTADYWNGYDPYQTNMPTINFDEVTGASW